MSPQTTGHWLKAASVIVIGFGLLTALAAWLPFNLPAFWLVDLMFLPFDGQPNLNGPEARLLSGILGGVLVGFGVTQWLISSRLYPREPGLARTIILASMGVWFVVDSIASVIAGAPFNVVMNVPFLSMFVVPLWRAQVWQKVV